MQSFFCLQQPVIISFDKKIAEYGYYDNRKDRHFIRVGVRYTEHLDLVCQKHEVINTLLHELYHAYQWQNVGSKTFYSKEMNAIEKCSNARINYQYCQLELEARSFADTNHRQAIQIYDGFAPKIPRKHRT